MLVVRRLSPVDSVVLGAPGRALDHWRRALRFDPNHPRYLSDFGLLAVREAYPDVAVVCLTASANLREVDALYEAGAVACLSKDQELDEIVDAIRQAA